MKCRATKVSTPISLILVLATLVNEPTTVNARSRTESSLAHQSTPKLNVRIYSLSGITAWTLKGAETEAARILGRTSIELNWIDCASPVFAAACTSPQFPTDLIVRIIAKALPNVSSIALGITDSSDRYAAAFVFYERVTALRTHTRPLAVMLGRVIAHELGHLLLPQQGHSELGLMRGKWISDDLRVTSSNSLGLPARTIQFMHDEALRRVLRSSSPID